VCEHVSCCRLRVPYISKVEASNYVFEGSTVVFLARGVGLRQYTIKVTSRVSTHSVQLVINKEDQNYRKFPFHVSSPHRRARIR